MSWSKYFRFIGFDESIGSSVPQYDVEEELDRLRKDLEEKRKIAIERMGSKWVLHPDHHVQKQEIPANSLGFK